MIATTGGPVAIERVTPERAPQSMVCLKRTSQVLPISGAYDDFVRPGSGVINRQFGGESFRLDLSDQVGSGDSWQLGVYLAHALLASNGVKLAGPEDAPDRIVWVTGKVNYDLEVESVDHIAEKVAAAESLFGGDIPVIALLPAGANADTAREKLPDGVTLQSVSRVAEALDALGIATSTPAPAPVDPFADEDEELPPPPVLKILALFAIVGAAAWFYWEDKAEKDRAVHGSTTPPVSASVAKPVGSESTPATKPPVVPEAKPSGQPPAKPMAPVASLGSLEILARYAPKAGRCAAVHFGTVSPVIRVFDPAGPKPCGFQAVVTLKPPARYVGFHVAVKTGRLIEAEVIPDIFDGTSPTSGRTTFDLDVPLRHQRKIEAEIIAVFGEKPVADALARLRHGGGLDKGSLPGIDVKRVSLSLDP